MRKIPTLFARDENDRAHVIDQVTPGCEWVVRFEGVATRKYDGTCVMFDGSAWWARREVKAGKEPPAGWVEVQRDRVTGKSVGWEPIAGSPFAKFHAEALAKFSPVHYWPSGTYELVGPKVQGNPERMPHHVLLLHETAQRLEPPRDFDGLRSWLSAHDFEGVVWHHPDGRMAKIKRRDFR